MQAVLPIQPKIVEKLLLTIVSYVTPIASTKPLAMSILDYILIHHEAELASVMEQLSPFPDLPEFAHLSLVIERNHKTSDKSPEDLLIFEIDNFLRLAQLEKIPIESIHHLARVLAERKEQLANLHVASEDTGKPLLNRLTCCLIQLAMNTKHDKPMIEAIAKVLGELGPGDLKTLVLHQSNNNSHSKTPRGEMEAFARNTDTSTELGLAIFPPLTHFLFTEKVELLVQLGPALLAALKTSEGQNFYAVAKTYRWPLLDILTLFKQDDDPNAETIIKASLKPGHFIKNVHDDILWLPGSKDHSSWLTTLTTTLIDTYSEGLFLSLLPVCRLEPEFCSNLLPFVVQSLLNIGGTSELEKRKVISKHINNALLAASSSSKASWIASLKSLLNIVQHLRCMKLKEMTLKQVERKKASPQTIHPKMWKANFQLDVNYLNAAKAAHSCSAHFTTVS